MINVFYSIIWHLLVSGSFKENRIKSNESIIYCIFYNNLSKKHKLVKTNLVYSEKYSLSTKISASSLGWFVIYFYFFCSTPLISKMRYRCFDPFYRPRFIFFSYFFFLQWHDCLAFAQFFWNWITFFLVRM